MWWAATGASVSGFNQFDWILNSFIINIVQTFMQCLCYYFPSTRFFSEWETTDCEEPSVKIKNDSIKIRTMVKVFRFQIFYNLPADLGSVRYYTMAPLSLTVHWLTELSVKYNLAMTDRLLPPFTNLRNRIIPRNTCVATGIRTREVLTASDSN